MTVSRSITIFAFSAVFCAGFLHAPACAEKIAIYHTSDIHGWYYSRPADFGPDNAGEKIGGFAALSALLKKEKAPHLLLDSGDFFQGTPEGNFTKGLAIVKMMNLLGYGAAAVGNHEYDYFEDNLRKLAAAAEFPFLGANIYVKDTGKNADYAKPFKIFKVGKRKIAVIGVANKYTKQSVMPGYADHLDFRDEAAEVAKLMGTVQKKNPDAIMVLGHVCASMGSSLKIIGREWSPKPADFSEGSLAIARKVPGISVIMGGHCHAGFPRGYLDKESGVLVAESYSNLNAVSRIELNFNDKTGRLDDISSRLEYLWIDKTGEDAEVLNSYKSFVGDVAEKMGAEIGETEIDLTVFGGGIDSPMGNWMTDVMRKAAGAEMAFQNVSGIRAGIPKGRITARQVYQVMPFDNTLATMDLTGAQISGFMMENISEKKMMMQVSGLEMRYKTDKDGKAMRAEFYVDGRPLERGRVYRIVTNNYLASGGGGCNIFKEGKNSVDTHILIREAMMKEIRENSPVKMPVGGRIRKI